MHNGGEGSYQSYWRKLWNPRRLRVSSVNKTAQAVVLPSIKGISVSYGNCIRSFRDLIGNENPRRTSFSIGRLKCLALGVASASNTRLFALLNYKRTRMENLLILRWKQNRLSQVLTLFYSRIPEQNFRFGMIYDCLFESIWFTFREQVAPALSQNLDKNKTFRLSASCHSCNEWQAAGSRRR